MVKTRLPLLICLVLALTVVLPAGAEVFTVTLKNETEFVTRYQPQQDPRNENNIKILTEHGNWIALSKDTIVEVTSETESRGFGTVLDNHTVVIGWAPNDRPEPTEQATDPTSQLLNYLRGRDAAMQQDFSVQQFVNPDEAGLGGIPALGVSSSGSSSFPVAFGGTAAVEPSTVDEQ